MPHSAHKVIDGEDHFLCYACGHFHKATMIRIEEGTRNEPKGGIGKRYEPCEDCNCRRFR